MSWFTHICDAGPQTQMYGSIVANTPKNANMEAENELLEGEIPFWKTIIF